MVTVAVVDDEASMREFLSFLLTKRGYQVEAAASLAEFRSLTGRVEPDLVISDMKLGADTGLDVLSLARRLPRSPEVIIITAYGAPQAAVEAMRRGAYDYVCKPFDNEELLLLVERALEKKRLLTENERLRAVASSGRRFHLGESPAMQRLWAMVDKVAAASKATVLITGESGTGKEVVAQLIHSKSTRAAAPFVPVNCGALAEGVLESELFGHVKGAFTGAASDRDGILVSAGEGTVLLDEVGELAPSTQVKLLRVLQERRVKPVGSSTEIAFEARVIAATNKSLEQEVKAGRFREDLFFRLNVINLEVPPLRARAEDIGPLADFFLAHFSSELGRPGLRLAPDTLALLKAYPFSGNVRQLRNILERAATLSDTDVLKPDSLPPSVRGSPEGPPSQAVSVPAGFSLERHLDDIEREFLLGALRQSGGVKTRAAETLGLTFRSFRYRLAKHGLGDRDPS